MRHNAFTLVELLVTIAIIAILIGLSITGLSAARKQSRTAVSLSNLRTHGQVMQVYAMDFEDQLPYFTEIGELNNTITGGGINFLPPMSYFDAHRTWHIALADSYYTGDARSDVFSSPSHRAVNGYAPLFTSYYYGCTFIAAPRYWNERTRIGPEQYRSTRMGAVTFTSSKVLLVESWYRSAPSITPPDLTTLKRPAVLCDGSGRLLDPKKYVNGYSRGDGVIFRSSGAVHFADGPPYLHTVDGVRGRDIR